LGLLALLLGALGVGPTAAESAALMQLRGDTSAALAAADAILVKDPGDPGALFVAACAAIESGDLDRASSYAARLEQRQHDPHAAVLKKLIERRRAANDTPLREALVSAWKDAGCPDLGAAPLLRASESWGPLLPKFDREARARLTAGERFVFDNGNPATSSAFVEAAIRAAAEAEKNPVVVNLEILGALTPFDELAGVDLRVAAKAVPAPQARELVFPKADGTRMRADVNLEWTLRRALGRAGVVEGYRHGCRRQGCGYVEPAQDQEQRCCPRAAGSSG
jgi:hypothetical protein